MLPAPVVEDFEADFVFLGGAAGCGAYELERAGGLRALLGSA
jgi:hypothetical protein